jgi:hypothetical protein
MGRLLVVVHAERNETIRIMSVRRQPEVREDSMKKNIEHRINGDMRREYDFAAMKGGDRGKHHAQYREGTNVVLIEPDVAAAFPTEDAVNEALRGILGTARAVRRTGGLPDRALQTVPGGPKRRIPRSAR